MSVSVSCTTVPSRRALCSQVPTAGHRLLSQSVDRDPVQTQAITDVEIDAASTLTGAVKCLAGGGFSAGVLDLLDLRPDVRFCKAMACALPVPVHCGRVLGNGLTPVKGWTSLAPEWYCVSNKGLAPT